jgi:hypothetical protein
MCISPEPTRNESKHCLCVVAIFQNNNKIQSMKSQKNEHTMYNATTRNAQDSVEQTHFYSACSLRLILSFQFAYLKNNGINA